MEGTGVFGLEVVVELAEVGGEVGEGVGDEGLVLVGVVSLDLLLELEAAGVTPTCVISHSPR